MATHTDVEIVCAAYTTRRGHTGRELRDLRARAAVVGTTGLLEALLDLSLRDVGEVLSVELNGEILDD